MQKAVESEDMKGLKSLPEKKPREGKKHLVIAALLVLVAAAFWYNVRSFLQNGIQFESGRLVQLAATLLLFGAMNGLVGIVGFTFRDWTARISVYFFSLATHFIFFGVSYYSIVTVVLLWLFWMRYGRNTGWEERERIHFHIVKILSHTLGTVIIFSLLALAFTYYGVVARDAKRGDDLIDSLASGATDAALLTVGSMVEGFDANMTLDAFLNQYAGEQLTDVFPQGLIPENLERILSEQEEGVPLPAQESPAGSVDETLAKFQKTLLQEFGITAEGDDSVRDVVAGMVRERVNNLLEPYKKYIPPILAVSLFLTLSAFGLLYFWASVSMGWVVTKLLFLVKILKIEERSKPIENLIVE